MISGISCRESLLVYCLLTHTAFGFTQTIRSATADCRNSNFGVAADLSTSFKILPSGVQVPPGEIVNLLNTQWLFSGVLTDADSNEVGRTAEQYVRLSDNYWLYKGSYINLNGCSGIISIKGIYNESENSGSGTYAVVGGTGDFAGATGQVSDMITGLTSERQVTIN